MASGPQHYQMAELILDEAKKFMAENIDKVDDEDMATLFDQHAAMVGQAQAHATLANAAATAELDSEEGPAGGSATGRGRKGEAWARVFGESQ